MWVFVYVIFVLSCLTNGAIGDGDRSSPRVVIVGAGASGIAAATRLLENGIENIVILEAENRIGGRVNTIEFDDYAVDLGAQWVHGEKDNVVYELVNSLGLIDNSNDMSDLKYPIPYRSTGDMVNPDLFKDTADFFKELQDNEENITDAKQYRSIGDYFRTKFNIHFSKHPEINETIQKDFLHLFNIIQMTYDAADSWDQVSPDYYTEYKKCEGNLAINWKDRGYSTILDVLMKKIPDPTKELPIKDKIVLNAEVTNIDYTNEDGTIKVKTKDEKEYLADHVIVTSSIGVLKAEHKNWFNPPLPEAKARVIESLELGTVTKIILSFNEPWWTDKWPGFCMFWSEDDRERLQNDMDRKWMLDAFGFFPVEHKPRLLMGWVIGEGARHLETLPDDKILTDTMSMIREFLSHDYNITDARKIVVSRWFSNKHFRGTYSYRSVETEKLGGNAEKLAEPIVHAGKPAIQFAGEATSTHHFSTVHGAVETGWREADRIINLHKDNSIDNKST